MKKEESIDYESIKKQALEQFRSGKSLTGKGGAFALIQTISGSCIIIRALGAPVKRDRRCERQSQKWRGKKEGKVSDLKAGFERFR